MGEREGRGHGGKREGKGKRGTLGGEVVNIGGVHCGRGGGKDVIKIQVYNQISNICGLINVIASLLM